MRVQRAYRVLAMTADTAPAPDRTSKSTAPYTSFATFKNFLTGLRALGGVPIVIDNSVYGNMSGGSRSQLKATLRFLGLVDDANKPTEELHIGVAATQDVAAWRSWVLALLTAYYPSIISHQLTNTTPAALRKEFEAAFSGTPDVVTKSVTFFIHAAREAGVALSPRLTERQRGGGARRGAGRRKPEAIVPNEAGSGTPSVNQNQGTSDDSSQVTAEGLTRLLKKFAEGGTGAAKVPHNVQKAIMTIILYLTVGDTGALDEKKGEA
jgi:hypothetical protein